MQTCGNLQSVTLRLQYLLTYIHIVKLVLTRPRTSLPMTEADRFRNWSLSKYLRPQRICGVPLFMRYL